MPGRTVSVDLIGILRTPEAENWRLFFPVQQSAGHLSAGQPRIETRSVNSGGAILQSLLERGEGFVFICKCRVNASQMRMIHVTLLSKGFQLGENLSGARNLSRVRITYCQLKIGAVKPGGRNRFITFHAVLPPFHRDIDMRDWIFVVEKLRVDLDDTFGQPQRALM